MGLLDAGNYLTDPQNAAQLGLISGLFQAGAPSRMPVSFGQALGAGFQGANQAQSAAMDRQAKQIELQQNAYGLQKAGNMNLLMHKWMIDNGLIQPDGTVTTPPQSQPQSSPAPSPAPANTSLLAPPNINTGGSLLQQSIDNGLNANSQSLLQASPTAAPSSTAPVVSGPSPVAGLSPNDMMGGMAANYFGGPAAETAYYSRTAPTDFDKALLQSGVVPGSQEWATAHQKLVGKDTYITPTALRTDKYIDPATGKVKFAPTAAPDGWMTVEDPSQPSGYKFVQIGNATNALQNVSQATASGKAAVEPITGYDSNSQPRFTNKLAASQGGGGMGGGLTPVPSLGVPQGANNAQEELTKNWKDLQDRNSESQNIISYLNTIKDNAKIANAAPVSAVGPYGESGLAVDNALSKLPSFVPGSQSAQAAVNANALMGKAANQIIGRLSKGDMGTDAGKAISTLATPGSHMPLQATLDAADNLIGAQQMLQAKTKVLADAGNSRNQPEFQRRSQIFDTNADPTLLQQVSQYKSLTPGSAQAKAYIQSVIQKDPTFLNRMHNLDAIGAF